MATSGSSNWTQTRDNIIQQVLEICNMVGVGETPAASLVTMVSTHLNQYIKSLQTKYQLKIWKAEDWATKTFSAASEVTGTDSNVYTCIRSHTSAASNKPVTGADWSTYWKLEGSTGGTWVTATAYTSTGDFTDSTDLIGIQKAFLRKDGVDTPIDIIGHNEYMEISNKNTWGSPNKIWFDNRLSPRIYLHPQLDDTDDVIHYLKIMRIEDFDATGDTPDFPVHWIEPIVWGVAEKVAVIGGITGSRLRDIKETAAISLSETLSSMQEDSGSLIISPDLRGYDNY